MPADPAIAVDGLVARFGSRTVLDGLTLTVAPGEIVALLGPNGAGKTTTARCIAGLRAPDGGAVRVLGCDPAQERATVTAQLGVMPQTPGCHRQATPRELLRTFARLFSAPREPEVLLERVGLKGAARAKVRTLSGGEVQRLSLALALVGRPRALLLDEPTAGIDPHGRRDVWALLAEHAADGVAVLLTTHSLDEAARVADAAAVLDRGQLQAWDAPSQLSASAGRGVLIDSPDPVDSAALGAALNVAIEEVGGGRWRAHLDADRIPEVAAWFSEQRLRLSGIRADAPDLEDVYLRLTGREGDA